MHVPDDAVLDGIVLVPLSPGPLIAVAERSRARDEVDEFVDELFGPEEDVAPGPLDLVLVAGGLALLAAAAVWLHSNVALAAGIGMVALGSILPVRAGWHAVRARRRRRRREALLARGLPLNVGDPLTRSLAQAYERLLAEAGATEVLVQAEAATAAHAALVEVASLLGHGVPSGAAEEAYVRKRLEAIEGVAVALRAARDDEARRSSELEAADAHLERAARTQAGDELDALGIGAVNDLETLSRAIRAIGRERDT